MTLRTLETDNDAALRIAGREASASKAPFRHGYLIVSLTATALALITASECRSIFHLPSLLYGALFWGWWACVCSVLWVAAKRIPSLSSFSAKAVGSHVVAAIVLGAVHLCLLAALPSVPGRWPTWAGMRMELHTMLTLNRLGTEILIYGFVVGIIGVIQFQLRMQREAMQSLSLQKQLSEAHLRALQMQLEPHFLFNTLNAITTLVEFGRQQEAAEMLGHLNAILKTTLTRTTPQKVPLSQELELVENYLAIEQVRFADRLRIEIHIDPGAMDGLVPSFLLQPIVENAIKHGIAHCEHNGLVEASAIREGDLLHVWIRDTGPEQSNSRQKGHGIGLSNTRERLDHFYQDSYRMLAQPLAGGGFEVAITIPFERVEV